MLQKFSIKNLGMKHHKIDIDFFEPQVMAILNVTPDSFYEKSRAFTVAEIESRVAEIVNSGATIIDIGGYSSRPGAEDVTSDEEWSRVDRALQIIRRVAPNIAVSIDTFRSDVAERALDKYGAAIINDISAGELDPKLMEVAAKYRVPYIAMHMRGTPQTMQQQTQYDDIADDVVSYFKAKIEQLRGLGVKDIIIDPGFGFAKTLDQNYILMAHLKKLTELGCPILVGISRKSMIYKLLDSSAKEALNGTIALNWEALRQGATIIRVHDVKEAVDTVTIYKKLVKA